jgi:hypothetical protein
MNQRSIFTLSAIAALGLALLPSSIAAQQGTLKQQLVGTWTLVSCETTVNDIKQPTCVNPNGILILDANGRYALVQAARGRPKPATTGPQNRLDVTPEYYKAIAQGVGANFGTWSVNETDKTMTVQVEGALFPAFEGAEAKLSVNLTGDELRYAPSNNPAAVSVWRRTK